LPLFHYLQIHILFGTFQAREGHLWLNQLKSLLKIFELIKKWYCSLGQAQTAGPPAHSFLPRLYHRARPSVALALCRVSALAKATNGCAPPSLISPAAPCPQEPTKPIDFGVPPPPTHWIVPPPWPPSILCHRWAYCLPFLSMRVYSRDHTSLTPSPLLPLSREALPHTAIRHHHEAVINNLAPTTSAMVSSTPSYNTVPRSSPAQWTSTPPPPPSWNVGRPLPLWHQVITSESHAAPLSRQPHREPWIPHPLGSSHLADSGRAASRTSGAVTA
jgi:hypothetical protein